MKILFICNQNKNRSKTAEKIFKKRFKTKSAGIFNSKPVKNLEIEWADTVVVMEEKQRSIIAERFPTQYLKKRIISFDIPDIYKYNQSNLINILKEKVSVML